MRLLSFEVEGFKNFRRRLVLRDLDTVNIIHGENGVGKSNLLQAIQLFFAIPKFTGGIPNAEEEERLAKRVRSIEMDQIVRFGAEEQRDFFDLNEPKPILLAAVLELKREDFAQAGVPPVPWMGSGDESVQVYLGYRLSLERGIQCRLEGDNETGKLNAESGMDMPSAQQWVVSAAIQWMLGNIREGSGRANEESHEAELIPRMKILDTKRLQKMDVSGLASDLHRLKESRKQRDKQVWRRFVEGMKSFKHILGEGEIQVHKPSESEAGFSFEPADGRELIPYHLLGTGTHQLICFVGQLLTLRSSFVGIEEPEMNLKPNNQRILSGILRDMIGKPGAPSQIFMTSHSEELEQEHEFYYIKKEHPGDDPIVERLPFDRAQSILSRSPAAQQEPVKGAVQCYVSMDGATRIPKAVMERVGIPNGGGVMYLRELDGKTLLLSDADYVKEIGFSDDGNSSGES